jgi:hypothetical protein
MSVDSINMKNRRWRRLAVVVGGRWRFSKLKAWTKAGDVQLLRHTKKAWSGPGDWKAANGRQTTTAKRRQTDSMKTG